MRKPIKNADQFNDLVTQGEATNFLKLSKPTFIKLRRNAKIPFYRIGRKLLFKKTELLEAIKTHD